RAMESSSPTEVGAAAAAYFNPKSYGIAEQKLPEAMPAARLSAILGAGSAHFKEALLASLPHHRLLEAGFRVFADAILSTSLRLVSTLWVHGKLGRRQTDTGTGSPPSS